MKNFMISGAIFDLDGTLLDSMMIWEDFASAYLRSRGIDPPAGLEGRLESLTLSEAAEYLRTAFSLPEGREEILDGMNRTADARYDTVLPKPGVREMLAALSLSGVPMAVATLTDRPTVLRTLSRLGLLSYFSHVFTCAEVGARKDTPVIYEAALAALGTPKAETAVFEDALYAMQTAAAAGFPVVAVYDPSGADRFEEAAALAALTVTDYRTVSWGRYPTKVRDFP